MHSPNLNACLGIISTLARGIILPVLVFSFLASGTYLAYQSSVRCQQRIGQLHRGVDRMTEHLNKMKEERELRRILRYAPDWLPLGLWGGLRPYRRPSMVQVIIPWVFTQHGDGNVDNISPLDTRLLGQQISTSECEGLNEQDEGESRACDCRTAQREGQEWYQRFGRSEQLPGSEQQQAHTEPALGTRVNRNSSSRRSRVIAEATDPRRYGIPQKSSSCSDDDGLISQGVNSPQSSEGVDSISGTTLCDAPALQQSNAHRPLGQIPTLATRYYERPDDYFEYWHHNDDDDPDPTIPFLPSASFGDETTITYDGNVESTSIDVLTGPIPSQTVSITASRDDIGMESGNRVNIPAPRFRRAQIAQMARDLENVHVRRNGRGVEGRAALEGAGLNSSNTPTPTSTTSGDERGDEQEERQREEEIAAWLATPVQWPPAPRVEELQVPPPTYYPPRLRRSRDAYLGNELGTESELDRFWNEHSHRLPEGGPFGFQGRSQAWRDGAYEMFAQHQAGEFVRQHSNLAEQGREPGYSTDLRPSTVATRTLMQNAGNAARTHRSFEVEDGDAYYHPARYPTAYNGEDRIGGSESEEEHDDDDDREVMDDLASHRSGSAPLHIRGGAGDEDENAAGLRAEFSAPVYVGLSSDDDSDITVSLIPSKATRRDVGVGGLYLPTIRADQTQKDASGAQQASTVFDLPCRLRRLRDSGPRDQD